MIMVNEIVLEYIDQGIYENSDIKRLGIKSRVIRIIFGDYSIIRIVAKNRPIKVMPNTIREYNSNRTICGEHCVEPFPALLDIFNLTISGYDRDDVCGIGIKHEV